MVTAGISLPSKVQNSAESRIPGEEGEIRRVAGGNLYGFSSIASTCCRGPSETWMLLVLPLSRQQSIAVLHPKG